MMRRCISCYLATISISLILLQSCDCPDSDSPIDCDPCPADNWNDQFVAAAELRVEPSTAELSEQIGMSGGFEACPDFELRQVSECHSLKLVEMVSFQPTCVGGLILAPGVDFSDQDLACPSSSYNSFSKPKSKCDSLRESSSCWRFNDNDFAFNESTEEFEPVGDELAESLRIYSRFQLPQDLEVGSALSADEFFSRTDGEGDPTLIIVRTFESRGSAASFPFEGVERDEDGVLRCSDVYTGYFSRPNAPRGTL